MQPFQLSDVVSHQAHVDSFDSRFQDAPDKGRTIGGRTVGALLVHVVAATVELLQNRKATPGLGLIIVNDQVNDLLQV